MTNRFKEIVKRSTDRITDFMFRRRRFFRMLRLYPRARNYVYDIINYREGNDLKIILDVGANTGQSAVYFNKMFPGASIHCFEPIASTFETLQKNLGNRRNITCHNFALGADNGREEIPYEPDSGMNSLVKEVYASMDSTLKQVVEIGTIDGFLNDSGLERIDLIKIDTEGFDFKVLVGAEKALTGQAVDFIVCEVGFLYEKGKGDFERINRWLHEKGYWLSGIYDNYYWGNKFVLHGFANAMYIRKELAFDPGYA